MRANVARRERPSLNSVSHYIIISVLLIGVFGSESKQCRCGFACNEPKFVADEQVKHPAITEKIAVAADSAAQTFRLVGDHIA